MPGWVDLKFWRTSVWKDIQAHLRAEEEAKIQVFPPPKQIFRSLSLTPLTKVKVVILGQDPYHTPGAADGLAFSVPVGYRTPPSLVNIFKELQSDLKSSEKLTGPLDGWAKQGVLLINSVWTVRAHFAQSHAHLGWQNLTREIIQTIATEVNNQCVFCFWGSHAQTFEQYTHGEGWINKLPHPSPFSAHTGFLGGRPFSFINDCLIQSGEIPIDWSQVNSFES